MIIEMEELFCFEGEEKTLRATGLHYVLCVMDFFLYVNDSF
jgi:hypothetical protein